jgi:aspartyl-tRNA(Asn)/glutamyl-tRNA(Gln) amidotransferase subunit C
MDCIFLYLPYTNNVLNPPMDINIERIAKLAKLSLTDKEKEKYGHELSHILDHVADLEEVDTQDIPATNQSTGLEGKEREDKATTEGIHAIQDALLSSSPYKEEHFIKVPPVF